MATKIYIETEKALSRFITDYLVPSRSQFAVDPIPHAPFTHSTVTIYKIEPIDFEEAVKDVDLTDIEIAPYQSPTKV